MCLLLLAAEAAGVIVMVVVSCCIIRTAVVVIYEVVIYLVGDAKYVLFVGPRVTFAFLLPSKRYLLINDGIELIAPTITPS